MKKYQASYYNGKTSTPIGVEVFVSKQGIHFEYVSDTGVFIADLWKHHNINKYELQKDKLTFYYGERLPFQILSLQDVSFLDEVETHNLNYKYLKDPYRFFSKIGTLGYVGAIVGVVLFTAMINFIVLPFLVTQVANSFPQEYEESLGNQAFLTQMNFLEVDSAQTILVKEFTDQIDFMTDYNIDVYVVNQEVVNAYALPGGKIVVFQGILDRMEGYEELAALLGHEIGHVQEKHSLRILMKQYSHQFLLSLVVGNSSDVYNKLGGVVSQFSQLAFSRDAEREADDYGMNVLRHNEIDNYGAVRLFEKLKDEHEHDDNDNEGYLKDLQSISSTHPNTDERIETMKKSIEELGNNGVGHPELELIWDKIKN